VCQFLKESEILFDESTVAVVLHCLLPSCPCDELIGEFLAFIVVTDEDMRCDKDLQFDFGCRVGWQMVEEGAQDLRSVKYLAIAAQFNLVEALNGGPWCTLQHVPNVVDVDRIRVVEDGTELERLLKMRFATKQFSD
jgi:hypothetical protein